MIELERSIIEKAIRSALDKGHEFAEVFAERQATTSVSLENNKLDKVRSGIDAGVGFRIINKDKTYYGFVNSLAEKDILRLAQEVSAFGKVSRAKSAMASLGEVPSIYCPEYKLLPHTISLQDKIAKLDAANKAARQHDARIIQAAVRYADIDQQMFVANSEGVFAQDHRVRTRFVVEAIAQDAKNLQTGFEAPGEARGFEFFENNDPAEIAITAARRAILSLEADPAPAGAMTVVLAGSAGGTMIHEACGHALEADFIYKQTSIFTGSLGQKRVSPLVTVVDDGTVPGNYGALAYDDEGTPTQKNILIERGVVRAFMNDHLYAKLLGHTRTGNGRRESYRYAPIPRMTNTYLDRGPHDLQDMIASVTQGLLVKKMGGGQVDITNGNFVFEITEGYLIKHGKIDRPVRGATLVGNGVEVLSTVDMIGSDVCFIPGMCGKGQSAPVSDAQPSIRIPKIVVGGQ